MNQRCKKTKRRKGGKERREGKDRGTHRQNVMVPSSRSIRQLTMSPAAHDWGEKTRRDGHMIKQRGRFQRLCSRSPFRSLSSSRSTFSLCFRRKRTSPACHLRPPEHKNTLVSIAVPPSFMVTDAAEVKNRQFLMDALRHQPQASPQKTRFSSLIEANIQLQLLF